MGWNDVVTVAGPLVAIVFAWYLNERSKSKWERHKKKEKRYVALIDGLSGFYTTADPDEAKAKEARAKKDKFLDQLKLAWLYCPDEVIRKCNGFLKTVSAGNSKVDGAKELAWGEFVLEARKDLMGKGWLWRKKTKLAPDEFKIWTST